eukprot:GHVT01100742.1.p4 GENE.GHVT01100742.1~~GHVT01100742.1.p4  ORF type:complete len:106 (-),score=14.89 GHVT01100742.1:457-774(-)
MQGASLLCRRLPPVGIAQSESFRIRRCRAAELKPALRRAFSEPCDRRRCFTELSPASRTTPSLEVAAGSAAPSSCTKFSGTGCGVAPLSASFGLLAAMNLRPSPV